MPFTFELDRLTSYSNADIEDEIRRVSDLQPNALLPKREFDKSSKVHSGTVIARFGSWQAGLQAAGRGHLYAGGPVTQKMRAQESRELEDEAILEKLRQVAQALGHDDLTLVDIVTHSSLGEGILRRRFGTTRRALQAAGLTVRPRGRRYTDDECFENLYEVWRHYGRRPTFSQINNSPSKVGGEAYTRRFGTWMKALSAFVDRVNAEPDGMVAPTQSTPQSSSATLQAPKNVSRHESRDVQLGARFQVLQRDRFKCVLCGDAPATNSACELHVDHVVPWSRGGKNDLTNLRTLCARCNVGRGDRYDADDQPYSGTPATD